MNPVDYPVGVTVGGNPGGKPGVDRGGCCRDILKGRFGKARADTPVLPGRISVRLALELFDPGVTLG